MTPTLPTPAKKNNTNRNSAEAKAKAKARNTRPDLPIPIPIDNHATLVTLATLVTPGYLTGTSWVAPTPLMYCRRAKIRESANMGHTLCVASKKSHR